MANRRIALGMVIAGLLFFMSVGMAQIAVGMAPVQEGALRAIRADEPTRRFVELYLRLAGAVWVAVEWIAAIYLILGYRRLARWFGRTGEAS